MKILSGSEIINRGIVSGIQSEKQIQPAGVDVTVGKIFRIVGKGQVDYDNRERKIAEREEVKFDENGWADLKPGTYIIVINELVNLPKTCIGLGKPRSSITRNGCSIETALWDPGYHGKSEVLLVVYNSQGIKIKRGARIMQMVFLENSEELGEYTGVYKGENVEK
jgi:dUTP pyrophosphatase